MVISVQVEIQLNSQVFPTSTSNKHFQQEKQNSPPLPSTFPYFPTMSVDFNTLAQQFTEFYYNQFDSDRTQLGNLYREQSMLTFETSQLQGAADIVEKLVSLPFAKVAHRITTLDAQPASPAGDVLVMITGDLLIDEEQNPQRFSQVFHLIPENNSYYVFNDIFRLNYSA
ncbi:Nuclear transport factor 2 [Hanseniaspora osmophila]|uniref:Nuclear transport factor 2 n=1 Tax=Hanseniaspora osmophila TaxID=56408 RepID=A0A1E5R4T8_9ASCO|nr:Nuclear transport factor 2 [Hanseniaspora osmophila]